MFEPLFSLLDLRWTNQPQLRPLPDHIKRTFVPTPSGNLELLVASPSNTDPSTPSIFFIHGGYGSAGVWLEWMTYLLSAGFRGRIYAYSARNHGASYSVNYLRMVYRTGFEDVVGDFIACLDFARSQLTADGLSEDVILVGHSSGGGLVQYALAHERVRCRALALIDAVPHFGMLPVYANWYKHDPWFPLRSLLHLQHPTSPLSSPELVHGAFFGHKFPMYKVPGFMRWMPSYECMGWPIAMMGSFAAWWRGASSWLDVKDILRSISDLGEAETKDKVCVMLGGEDVLMDVAMGERQVDEFREGLNQLRGTKEGDELESRASTKTTEEEEGVSVDRGQGVRMVVVNGAGHHVQNDIQHETAAVALRRFVQQY